MIENDYTIEISNRFYKDFDYAIDYKVGNWTSDESLKEFKKEVSDKIESLKTTPFIGMDLNSRIRRKTDYRYLVADDGKYMIFYKVIASDLVKVSRILATKSNWQRILR